MATKDDELTDDDVRDDPNEDQDDDAGDDENDGDDDDSGDDSDDDAKDGDKKDPELAKAIRRRDRAIATARRLKAELEAATKKDDDKPDPVAEANNRLVRTAAHGVLRGLGVDSKEDRIEILDMLNLSDVEVTDDGADEDMIEEKVELLRRVFGAKPGAPGRTPPRTVKTRRDSKDTTTDPDAARYKRILRS